MIQLTWWCDGQALGRIQRMSQVQSSRPRCVQAERLFPGLLCIRERFLPDPRLVKVMSQLVEMDIKRRDKALLYRLGDRAMNSLTLAHHDLSVYGFSCLCMTEGKLVLRLFHHQ